MAVQELYCSIRFRRKTAPECDYRSCQQNDQINPRNIGALVSYMSTAESAAKMCERKKLGNVRIPSELLQWRDAPESRNTGRERTRRIRIAWVRVRENAEISNPRRSSEEEGETHRRLRWQLMERAPKCHPLDNQNHEDQKARHHESGNTSRPRLHGGEAKLPSACRECRPRSRRS